MLNQMNNDFDIRENYLLAKETDKMLHCRIARMSRTRGGPACSGLSISGKPRCANFMLRPSNGLRQYMGICTNR